MSDYRTAVLRYPLLGCLVFAGALVWAAGVGIAGLFGGARHA